MQISGDDGLRLCLGSLREWLKCIRKRREIAVFAAMTGRGTESPVRSSIVLKGLCLLNMEQLMKFPADDRYFRFTFANMQRLAGLLREFLPTELLAHLELNKLQRIHDQHVRENLKEVRDDLDVECPCSIGKVTIRILVEHKSSHAPKLWFQLMRSICAEWEQNGIAPIIPVVVHTGSGSFIYESPQNMLQQIPDPLRNMLPSLPIIAIDLAICTEEQIWASQNLDHVTKVALSILKLAQQGQLDISKIRKLLQSEWPTSSPLRIKRYIQAAITYLHFKSKLPRESLSNLRFDMVHAHAINPDSPFAQELREEHQKGVEQGIDQGIIEGLELEKIEVIQGMLAKGCDWQFIQDITHLNPTSFEELQAKHGKG